MGPVITHLNKGDVYFTKINNIENYLSSLPINFTSTVFRDPDDGTAYCTIYLGTPREVTREKFLFWEYDAKGDSECIAEIDLHMGGTNGKDCPYGSGNIFHSQVNKEFVLPVIEKISELFGQDLKVQLNERRAMARRNCVVSYLPERELPLVDRTYYHHTKLDVFA